MAAFCTCCGVAITTKTERCLVCGAPRHGMKTPAASTERIDKTAAGKPESKDYRSIA